MAPRDIAMFSKSKAAPRVSPTVVPGVSSVSTVVLIGDVETCSAVTDLCEVILRSQQPLAGPEKAVAVDAIATMRVRETKLNLMVFLRISDYQGR